MVTALIIHFLTGLTTMKIKASHISHVIYGIAWYHANGLKNHIVSSARKINVANFHLLNRKSALVKAAMVGVKNVSKPIDAAGLTYETSHPNAKPESVPHDGPSKDAVSPFVTIFDRVILALVPGIG